MKTQKFITCQKVIFLAQALRLFLLLNATVHPHPEMLQIFERTKSSETSELFRVITSTDIFLGFQLFKA